MVKVAKQDYFDDSVPDFTEERKQLQRKSRNVGNCHREHQVVIDTDIPIPPVNRTYTKGARRSTPRMPLRVYDAIYILKPNQSTFYAKPAGRSDHSFQTSIRGACNHAKKWIKGTPTYTLRTITENGVVGIRVWRTK